MGVTLDAVIGDVGANGGGVFLTAEQKDTMIDEGTPFYIVDVQVGRPGFRPDTKSVVYHVRFSEKKPPSFEPKPKPEPVLITFDYKDDGSMRHEQGEKLRAEIIRQNIDDPQNAWVGPCYLISVATKSGQDARALSTKPMTQQDPSAPGSVAKTMGSTPRKKPDPALPPDPDDDIPF